MKDSRGQGIQGSSAILKLREEIGDGERMLKAMIKSLENNIGL